MELKIYKKTQTTRLQLFFGVFLVCFNQYSTVDFVTFVEEEKLIERKEADFQNVTVNGAKIESRNEVLSKDKGLSHIIERLSKVRQDSDASKAVHSSYVGEKTGNIIKEVYASSNKNVVSFGARSCSEAVNENHHMSFICTRYKSAYVDTLKTLMGDLFMWPLMVVVDEDPCAQRFAKALMQEFNNGSKRGNQQETRKLYFHEVAANSTILKSLSAMLYKATTASVTTIILLCSEELATLIFSTPQLPKFLRSNAIWVTLESNLEESSTPSLLLKLQTEGDLENLMPSLSLQALAMLNVKAQALLEKECSKVCKTMEQWATTNTSMIACRMSNRQKPTVLVSLRKELSHWIPMYRWSSDNKMTLLSYDGKISWLSRSQAYKPMIKVVSILQPPFVAKVEEFYDKTSSSCSQGVLCRIATKTSNASEWQRTCCVGYIMDLVKQLQKDLWLSMDVYMVEDGFYGSVVDGKWNGMVGDLVSGKAEIAMAPLTATSKRSQVIDFGASYMEISFAILVTSDASKNIQFLNFSFVASIARDLLLVLAAIFILGLLLIFLLENRLWTSFKVKIKNFYNFKDAFTYLSGITFQRDLGGKNPKQASARIAFVPFAFAMVIVMSTYTATLTAVKVKNEDQDVIKGLQDKRITSPSDAFKFTMLKSSSTEEYFRFSENPIYHNIYLFMKKYSVNEEEIAIKKVLNGQLQAYIAELPQAQYFVSKRKACDLRIVTTESGKSTWNVAFRRGSPWNSIISRKVLEYRERGFFDELHGKWMASKCIQENGITSSNDKFTVEYFGGLIVIFACSFAFCVVILLIEHCYYKRKRQSIKYSFEES